jgi:acid phosphatase
MRIRAGVFILLFLSTLLFSGCGGSVGTTTMPVTQPPVTEPPVGGGPASIPVVTHVAIVVLENTNFADAHNSTNMPYLNSLLARGALATSYYAVGHPSIPNYFTMTTGLTETFDDAFQGTISDDNVVRELGTAGKNWKVYAESLPSAGYLGGDVSPYVKHHDPFVYLSDVQQSSTLAQNIVNFSQFSSDLATNVLPNYFFIVPNIVDDAHDCPAGGTNCNLTIRLQRADAWLQANIDPLVNNANFNQSGLLILTFDESENDDTNGGGQIMTVLLGTHVKQGYSGDAAIYDHRSLLDLSLKALGVMNVPNGAAQAPEMTEFFQ